MPRLTPYLQRRGDTLFFRIAVPLDLRHYVGGREITKTLRTTDRRIAIPRALLLASKALQLFEELRTMPNEKKDGFQFDFGMNYSFDELGLPKLQFTDVKPGDEQAIIELTRQLQPTIQAPTPTITNQHNQSARVPLLSAVIDDFLQKQDGRDIAEMMKKHRLVLPFFLRVLGDKRIGDIRQADIEDFFGVVNRLPKYWQYDLEKGFSIEKIINLPDRIGLSEWTFKGTYRASVAKLLKWARSKYQDQGFPTTLTVEEMEYLGNRKKGEQQKQRAFTQDELKRLFEGPEIQTFAADPKRAHQYWLPHIGLFTGARVNEVCQINPQADIHQDLELGIWYFLITDETETHKEVNKSVKTQKREIPIHPKLIELGFLAYVDRVKATGSKLLFPEWKPKGGRAAPYAAEFFTDFLKQLGIHGVKNQKGFAPRGMHAFRHTLLTYGYMQGENLFCISGHVEDSEFTNKVGAGYIDMEIARSLTEKKQRLDRLNYGIKFHPPATL